MSKKFLVFGLIAGFSVDLGPGNFAFAYRLGDLLDHSLQEPSGLPETRQDTDLVVFKRQPTTMDEEVRKCMSKMPLYKWKCIFMSTM